MCGKIENHTMIFYKKLLKFPNKKSKSSNFFVIIQPKRGLFSILSGSYQKQNLQKKQLRVSIHGVCIDINI